MGVLLTTLAIVVAVAVGVWSERRWPLGAANAARKALLILLYALLPPVIFFNLARAEIDLSHAVGLGLALVAVSLTGVFTWWMASRVLRLPRHQTGAVVCAVLSVNTGYLGYPLTVALLGRGELSTSVLYDVLVTGPSLLLGPVAGGGRLRAEGGRPPARPRGGVLPPHPAALRGGRGTAGAERPGAAGPGRRLAGADRRDPPDRVLRRRRPPRGGRGAG